MTLEHHVQYWNGTRYDDYEYDRDLAPPMLNVEPDERVGPPLPNRRKARLRRAVMALILGAGGWAAIASLGWEGVLATAKSLAEVVVSNAQEIASRVHQERETASDPANQAATEIRQPEGLPELTPMQDEQAAPAAEPQSTEVLGEAYAEKAEPAEDDKETAPKRKSAIEAGLSPDLPNVLLTRLTKADLKNAAYAIKTALAKTPDDASFTWPLKPSRQQALFEIRFVPGAAEGCRRYIVTVTKDRWSSTSAAIEKCGATLARAS
jgi:hypothetical protein